MTQANSGKAPQEVRHDKQREIPLSKKEIVSLYRCAFYSAMGIKNGEKFPTDSECIRWLTKTRQHAEKLQSFDHLPALGMLPHWRIWIEEKP